MRRRVGIVSDGEFLTVLTQSMGNTSASAANTSCAVQVIPESWQNSAIPRAGIFRARQWRSVRLLIYRETRGTLQSDIQAASWRSVLYGAAFE